MTKPLLLRWNGSTWKQAAAPHLAGDTLLFDVTTDALGSLTVMGSPWDDADARTKGFAATRQHGKWSISQYEATPRDSVFTGVDGDPSSGGWLGGRDLKSGLAARTCTSGAAATVVQQGKVRERRRRATRAASASSSAAVSHPAGIAPSLRTDLERVASVRLASAGKLISRIVPGLSAYLLR